MFKSYNDGIKIINKSVNKNQIVFENKKLIKYGEKILNLTYFKIIKFI